jgi:hypothetical protein
LPASASPAGVEYDSGPAQLRGFSTTTEVKRPKQQDSGSTLISPFFCPKDGVHLTDASNLDGCALSGLHSQPLVENIFWRPNLFGFLKFSRSLLPKTRFCVAVFFKSGDIHTMNNKKKGGEKDG